MKIETSKLTGAALDWAVAKCEGYSEIKIYAPSRQTDRGWVEVRFNPEPKASTARFDPSSNWEQGGPIIEREKINLVMDRESLWAAQIFSEPYYRRAVFTCSAEPPLVAAMRCYVASKLGDDIEVPEELTQ